MTRHDLEDLIMQAWITKEDIDLVTWRLLDSEQQPSEDEIANILIGLSALHDSRMLRVMQCYEQLLAERKISLNCTSPAPNVEAVTELR